MSTTARRSFRSLCAVAALLAFHTAGAADCPGFLDHEFRKLHSSQIVNPCDEFAGRPILVVNTASHCGFTPQFAGLEKLYQKYKSQGLVILGFPSDDFNQAAANEEKAAEVCFINYGVSFPMMSPISVKGDSAHPLFTALAESTNAPSWNFNKYLIDPDGEITHFRSGVTPQSELLTSHIEKVL